MKGRKRWGMYMRKGYCKKKVLTVISGLVFLSMVLCSCDSSVGKTSEHNSTESITESNVPESSTSSEGRREEEFPFDGMENLTCHEYDEENILGLSAIYVGEQMLVFCFQRNEIWRDYEANHVQTDVIGLDEKGYPTGISSYALKESKSFFWIQIECSNGGEAAGIGVTGTSFAYSVFGLDRTLVTNQKGIKGDITVIEKQVYENNQWGEPVEFDVGPKHVPN